MYTDISYKDREYTIVYNVIKNENGKSAKYLMMLYWIDKTDFLQMQKKYNEEKNAIMLIQVDGYDEVLKSADEENNQLDKSLGKKRLKQPEKQEQYITVELRPKNNKENQIAESKLVSL